MTDYSRVPNDRPFPIFNFSNFFQTPFYKFRLSEISLQTISSLQCAKTYYVKISTRSSLIKPMARRLLPPRSFSPPPSPTIIRYSSAVVPNRWAADRCRSVDQLVPGRARNTVKALLPFPTTYLCEAGFSAVTATKTKYRNKLDISNTLRVSYRCFFYFLSYFYIFI